MPPELSIVIVNYHTRQFVLDCLASIEANRNGLHLEIIVIDNASADGLLEEITQRFPKTRTVGNPVNLFFSDAYTQGIRLATAPYILALNPDMLVRGDVLRQMLAAAQSHPAWGALSTTTVYTDSAVQRYCARFITLRHLFLQYSPLRLVFPGALRRSRDFIEYADWDRTTEREVDALPGSCILAPRGVWNAVGGFDAHMPMYFSDEYFCRRVAALGHRLGYVVSDGIVHFESASAKQFSDRAQGYFYRDLIVYTRLVFGLWAACVLWLLLLPSRLRLAWRMRAPRRASSK